MTRTARICSGTIRIGHFSCGTIEGGTPTQLAEYFVKRLSYDSSAEHNKCTPHAHSPSRSEFEAHSCKYLFLFALIYNLR